MIDGTIELWRVGLLLLQKNLIIKSKSLSEICEKNRYTLQFLLSMAELRRKNAMNEIEAVNQSDSESENDENMSENIEDMQFESNWNED